MSETNTTETGEEVVLDLYGALAWIDRKAHGPLLVEDQAAFRFLRKFVGDAILQNASAALASAPPATSTGEGERRGIYMASKTAHAPRWRSMRENGLPIISTWIDEAGKGETACFTDLWRRCVSEAANARAVIVYREPNEVLKGAFVEVGAALATGVPVFAVGCDEFSFVHHAGVTRCRTLEHALNCVLSLSSAPVPGDAGDLAGQGEKALGYSAGDILRIIEDRLARGEIPGHNFPAEWWPVVAATMRGRLKPDLAGQGEPVGWLYERATYLHVDGDTGGWDRPQFSFERPNIHPRWIRNIRAVYAEPAAAAMLASDGNKHTINSAAKIEQLIAQALASVRRYMSVSKDKILQDDVDRLSEALLYILMLQGKYQGGALEDGLPHRTDKPQQERYMVLRGPPIAPIEHAGTLAGQGEPVAWAYERRKWPDSGWALGLAASKAEAHRDTNYGIRNIRPLYAAPAPPRTAVKEEWRPISELAPQTNAVLGRWARSGDKEDGSPYYYWQRATGRYFDHLGERHWCLEGAQSFAAGPFYSQPPTHFVAIPSPPAQDGKGDER